jgi:hypothetical protein
MHQPGVPIAPDLCVEGSNKEVTMIRTDTIPT